MNSRFRFVIQAGLVSMVLLLGACGAAPQQGGKLPVADGAADAGQPPIEMRAPEAVLSPALIMHVVYDSAW